MSNPFDQRVRKNMDYMGTTLAQWSTVEIASTDRTTPLVGSESVARPTPQEAPTSALEGAYLGHRVQVGAIATHYEPVPRDFTPAPSLYAGKKDCCWLCGTNVKEEYLVQNQERRWYMPVGSECVGRFTGVSAEQSVKEHQWAQQRAALQELLRLRKDVWKQFCVRTHQGYGRYTTQIPYYGASAKAYQWYTSAKEVLGSLSQDSPNGAVSRWFATHSKEAYQLIHDGKALVAAKERSVVPARANTSSLSL